MKLAIVVALAPDRRSGRVLGDIMPADQAVALVKKAITDNKAPDPTLPTLAAFALITSLRQHRFSPTAEEIEAAGTLLVAGSADELNAALAANEKLLADLAASVASHEQFKVEVMEKVELLQKDFDIAKADRDAASARVSELEAQLAEAKDKAAPASQTKAASAKK